MGKAAARASGTARPAREAAAEAPAHIVRGGVNGAGSPGAPHPGRGPWLSGGPAPRRPWLIGRPGPLRRRATLPPSLPPRPELRSFSGSARAAAARDRAAALLSAAAGGLAPLGPKGIGFPGPASVSPPLPLRPNVSPPMRVPRPQPSADPRPWPVFASLSVPTSDSGSSVPHIPAPFTKY